MRPALSVIDLHAGASRRGPRARHQQVALGDRVDLAVRAAQRREQQRAAAQALGIAQGRDGDVDLVCPRVANGGSVAVTMTAAMFLSCRLMPGGQRDAELIRAC